MGCSGNEAAHFVEHQAVIKVLKVRDIFEK